MDLEQEEVVPEPSSSELDDVSEDDGVSEPSQEEAMSSDADEELSEDDVLDLGEDDDDDEVEEDSEEKVLFNHISFDCNRRPEWRTTALAPTEVSRTRE
jgi:hypothetical protein